MSSSQDANIDIEVQQGASDALLFTILGQKLEENKINHNLQN